MAVFGNTWGLNLTAGCNCLSLYLTLSWPYLELFVLSLFQVCDSDTVLDPACTIEMLKILEEDPMVGGVGGDVQVKHNTGKQI